MATKYGFSDVREQLVDGIKGAYPTKWEDFDTTQVLGEAVFGSPQPHPNTVLNLFLELKVKIASPFAAYRAALGGLPSLTICEQVPVSGSRIPQRPYAKGTAIPGGVVGGMVMFTAVDGGHFPAELALAAQCDSLVDGRSEAFIEQSHTINLRIEVIGLCVVPQAIVYPISTSTVAGVRWMGSAGEYRIS